MFIAHLGLWSIILSLSTTIMGIVSRQESMNVRDDKTTPNYSNGN